VSKTFGIFSWIGTRIGKPPGWERIVRLFASPEQCRGMKDVCVVRDGTIFVAQPGLTLGWNVAFFGTYEPELREIFRMVLREGGVAIDVGANVGWHTLLMARLVGQKGRILAAEANASVRDRLEENLHLNRFKHVETLPYAITSSAGTVEFHAPNAANSGAGSGHIVTEDAKQQGTVRVEARRLDDVVATAGIERLDLIKIDVEGFEWPVLQGGLETIAKFRPHIVFEYDANSAPRGVGQSQEIAEFFRLHRYRLFAVGRTWAEAVEFDNWPNCSNIWATPLPC